MCTCAVDVTIYGEKIIMLHVFETITVPFTNPFCSAATSFFVMNDQIDVN